MKDLKGILNMFKILLRSSKVIEGHYYVTSGLIQNPLIELKFDMNDRYVNPWKKEHMEIV